MAPGRAAPTSAVKHEDRLTLICSEWLRDFVFKAKTTVPAVRLLSREFPASMQLRQ